MAAPPKVLVSTMKPSEAVLFTPPKGKEDAYVMLVVDPVNNIFTATKASDKSVYTFKSTDEVVKIDASPLFPSMVIGPMLLALP